MLGTSLNFRLTIILPIGATIWRYLLSNDLYMRVQRKLEQERRYLMFLILAVVLVILWLGGFFVLHISSLLIHLLLIFAVISIIMNFVGGRRSA
jgi:multisubunit Na+/H+ antiporter MnhG subunit